MGSLSDRQRRLLARLPREQRIARVVGIALGLAGIAYIVWAVALFDPDADPTTSVGFDQAVVMPVAALHRTTSERIEAVVGETAREVELALRLKYLLRYSGGVSLLAFRVILGTIAAMLGFAILTVMIERSRLLAILEVAGIDADFSAGSSPCSTAEAHAKNPEG